MDTQEKICRFCLKICHNVKAMDGDIKEALYVLLPKIDLTAIQEPMVCIGCAKMLVKCCDFKAACLSTHDYLALFVNEHAVRLDLIEVYLSKTGTSVSQDQDICGFCMSPVNHRSAISLDVEERDVKLKNMIEQYLPELDLGIIKRPVICISCHDSLQSCFHFMTNCLIVEERIKKYCETICTNSKDRVELSSLLDFEVRDVTTTEVDSKSVAIIKVEKSFCEERENADTVEGIIANVGDLFKREQIFCDDNKNANEEVDLNYKHIIDMDDLKFKNEEQFLPTNMTAYKEESDKLDGIKEEFIEVEGQKCLLNEEVQIKTDEPDFNSVLINQALSEGTVKNLNKLNEMKSAHHYRNPPEVTMYKCHSCLFVTKYKSSLRTHQLTHRELSQVAAYKCERCTFVTKYKLSLRKHLLTHRKLSEVTAHKCENCSFTTQYKGNLKSHMLIHQELSEVTGNKCQICPFVTKRKASLRRHMLSHREHREVTEYSHQKRSEVTVYKCHSCSFVTKYKKSLGRHVLTHRELLEVTAYRCETCSFVTRQKSGLKSHVLTHQKLSEVTAYKCQSCSFVTKHKAYLQTHLLTHRQLSQVTAYKCERCTFVSKYKASLKVHMLVHREISEITVYKCRSCPFVTKYKPSLKSHMLVHQEDSEVTLYKCQSCPFVTKRKPYLKTHMLLHQELSEITAYTCETCSFVTRQKSNLKSHMLTHQKLQVTASKC